MVFTTPSVPLVGDRNVALNHSILWLADHQRSTPAAELQFFCAGMNPLSLKDLLKGCLLVAFFEKPPVLPWTLKVFRKPTSPPLPLREGPPLISVFFNSLYDPFGSPCRGQKRCSNRYAIRLADHQRSTPTAKLRFFVRGWTRLAEEHELKMIQIAGISGDKREFYRPIRFVIRSTPWRGRSS